MSKTTTGMVTIMMVQSKEATSKFFLLNKSLLCDIRDVLNDHKMVHNRVGQNMSLYNRENYTGLGQIDKSKSNRYFSKLNSKSPGGGHCKDCGGVVVVSDRFDGVKSRVDQVPSLDLEPGLIGLTINRIPTTHTEVYEKPPPPVEIDTDAADKMSPYYYLN